MGGEITKNDWLVGGCGLEKTQRERSEIAHVGLKGPTMGDAVFPLHCSSASFRRESQDQQRARALLHGVDVREKQRRRRQYVARLGCQRQLWNEGEEGGDGMGTEKRDGEGREPLRETCREERRRETIAQNEKQVCPGVDRKPSVVGDKDRDPHQRAELERVGGGGRSSTQQINIHSVCTLSPCTSQNCNPSAT